MMTSHGNVCSGMGQDMRVLSKTRLGQGRMAAGETARWKISSSWL